MSLLRNSHYLAVAAAACVLGASACTNASRQLRGDLTRPRWCWSWHANFCSIACHCVPGECKPAMLMAAACMQTTYDKLKSEVPKYKMITTSILSDRLKVQLHFSFFI